MHSVMVLLPDGFDDVIATMLAIDGKHAPMPMTDRYRTFLIRGFVYAYLAAMEDVPGMPEYAEAYRDLNAPRA